MKTHRSFCVACVAFIVAALALPLCAHAADGKTNPTGTWKWSFETQSGQTMQSTLKLKLADDKLSGALVGRDGTETPIKDASLKENQISFTVVRERNGQQMTSKYTGKIAGDTIKGKIETERDGQTRTRDWEAKRETANASGTWKWTFEVPNGPTFEPSVKLTQDGDKLTGSLTMGDSERPISEGTIKNGEISFKVLSKRDDRDVTSNYKGKLSGDTIKGKWDSDWTGEVVTRDWEAKRAKE